MVELQAYRARQTRISHNHQTTMKVLVVAMEFQLQLKSHKEKVKDHLVHSLERMHSHMLHKMTIMEPVDHQGWNPYCIIIEEDIVKTQQEIQTLDSWSSHTRGSLSELFDFLNIRDPTDPYNYSSFEGDSYEQSDYNFKTRWTTNSSSYAPSQQS